MAELEVNIINIEKTIIYGVFKNSNDKTVSKDINILTDKYYEVVSKDKESVLPFFVLSRNYNTKTRDFEMIIGSNIENDNLEKVIIPRGEYASITVRPKFGFMWGIAIGQAKRYFYTKYLPNSEYEALNMEYEFHTEKSKGKKPTIDIIFAINKK